MTHKIKGMRVEKYAYYVNKLSQNVGLETFWRQIVTSQTEHTIYKWLPRYWMKSPMKIFCVRHCSSGWIIANFHSTANLVIET